MRNSVRVKRRERDLSRAALGKEMGVSRLTINSIAAKYAAGP